MGWAPDPYSLSRKPVMSQFKRVTKGPALQMAEIHGIDTATGTYR